MFKAFTSHGPESDFEVAVAIPQPALLPCAAEPQQSVCPSSPGMWGPQLFGQFEPSLQGGDGGPPPVRAAATAASPSAVDEQWLAFVVQPPMKKMTYVPSSAFRIVGLWANGGRSSSANSYGPSGLPLVLTLRATIELLVQEPSGQWFAIWAWMRFHLPSEFLIGNPPQLASVAL